MDFAKMIQGEEADCIVRLKPQTNFQREDVRINNKQIILTDANNRILEEFDVLKSYDEKDSLQSIYENNLARYLTPFLTGMNVNYMAYGSTGSGKTTVIEGNKKEFGLIMMYTTTLFTLLNQKRTQLNSDPQSLVQNYSYIVSFQVVEIIDEQIIDLLALHNKAAQQFDIEDDEWNGPVIRKALWEPVQTDQQLADLLNQCMKNRNNTSNEFGKVSSKATCAYFIRLIQQSNVKGTDENLILKSTMSFFDLPGSEILVDDPETVRIKQGSTLNRVIIAMTQLIKDLGQKDKTDHVMYDTSTVTKLNKEILGANALSVFIFCLQHGDHKGSSLTLKTYKNCLNIQSYPIINDGKSLAIMKRYREDVKFGGTGQKVVGKEAAGQDGVSQQKMLELEKQQNENQQQIFQLADEKQRFAAKLSELRAKYQDLVKQKAELQQDLIKSEEDKLEVSKALVELEMENTRLLDIIQNEKYNQSSKLLNEDADILSQNLREEQAAKTIQQLQERLREVLDEKREFELEFMVLKKNYMNVVQELEGERLKQENFGLQLINLTNENKALSEELSNIYKKTGSQTEEGQRLVDRLDKLEREMREKDETMIFKQTEIERLKTELMRYQVQGHQNKVSAELKNLELEKSLMRGGNVPETSQFTKDTQQELIKNKDEKMLWESQKMELTHKIKSLQRRINDDQERIKEMERQMQELQGENQKMQLTMDEMRAIYRNKLIQFTSDSMKGKQPEISAREELVKDFQDKEFKLQDERNLLQKQLKQTKLDNRALRSYARNLRYIAEDWAPIGGQLPDILTKEPPYMVPEEQEVNTIQQDQVYEIERLRNRNKRLEDDARIQQELKAQQSNLPQMDTNSRIANELAMLKRPESSDQVRKERNDLQEENRKLVAFLKENKKWDILVTQRENERLMRMLKEYEIGNVGPTSGETKGLMQKVQRLTIEQLTYYEKMVKQSEKEKTELIVRSTMAEEQLSNLQQSLTRITHEYQKKINELKRQLQVRQ